MDASNTPGNHTHRLVLTVLALCLMLWAVLLVSGCRRADSSGGAELRPKKLQVVTTTGMVRDLVAALLNAEAEISAIMGPGVDPHLYQPTRGDAVKLLRADIVVYNGLHLEGRLGEVLENRKKSKRTTIAVAETLPADKLLAADAGLHDPHIWMDVSLWSEAAGRVAEQLAEVVPDQADSIRARSAAYCGQLAELDKWGASAIESIPRSQRVLITAHDAFRYFGKRYGVDVHGVQGVSTISDAGISDVNRLVELIVREKVPAVFFESSVSPRQVKAIVEGARQHGMQVTGDSTLLSDSMGAEGTTEGTYVGMMQYNFRTIVESLGGTVADDPSQLRQDSRTDSPAGEGPSSDAAENDAAAASDVVETSS